ncbi:MAG: YfiR family protein, partial [Terriglobales bacterium]
QSTCPPVGRTHRSREIARYIALLLFLFPIVAGIAFAQQSHPTDSQVKAAYLYNFGKFVTWPGANAGNGASFEICVLGRDPFGVILDSTVAGGNIEDKQVTAKKISSLQESDHCRIVFISSSEQTRLKPILAAAKAGGTLTVSDIPHFADKGGMIEFVPQENKIRFEVNLPATEEAGLILSSELLKVATRVIGKTGK